jgi:cytochrome c oxidase cbb3-type subunit 4
MDIGVMRGLLTAAIMILFLGIWAWSWSRKRRADFDAAAQLPLGDDSRPTADNTNNDTMIKERRS